MSESLNYIEAYFKGQLSDAEKKQFEQQCEADEEFAADVAFYITSRQAVREKLLEEKRRLWAEAEPRFKSLSAVGTTGRRIQMGRWVAYAAAACVIFALAFYFLIRPESPHQLADSYFKQKYSQLGQTMAGTSDSMQIGIAAYNSGDYQKALLFFQNIYQSNPDNSDAKMYTGIVYLKLNDYDRAIAQFDELAAMKLKINMGPFLKAVTLLHRDKGNDRRDAKIILEEVVRQTLAGSAQAKEWLEEWRE